MSLNFKMCLLVRFFAKILFCSFIFVLNSCVSHESLLYFRSGTEPRSFDVSGINAIDNLPVIRIQTNDLLFISVYTFDQSFAVPFNMVNPQAGGGGGSEEMTTYLVSEDGIIDFPVLGKIAVNGLTIYEAQEKVSKLLQEYIKDPVINMRIVNFRISVMGEVASPGMFTINNNKLSVLEALSMAGDLTPYSNRANILIVREQNGERTFGEINIQSPEMFKSPYFYLQQGDVVYVEPLKQKEAAIRDPFSEYAGWVASGLQIIISVFTLIALSSN